MDLRECGAHGGESALSRVIYLKIRTLWVWEVVFEEYEKCFISETEMFEARGARTERTSGALRGKPVHTA